MKRGSIRAALRAVHDAGGYAWDTIPDPKGVIEGRPKRQKVVGWVVLYQWKKGWSDWFAFEGIFPGVVRLARARDRLAKCRSEHSAMRRWRLGKVVLA